MLKGKDCRKEFKEAYENRYTWGPEFCGYRGDCSWTQGEIFEEGSFEISPDLKANVFGIDNDIIEKGIASQLWEVAIHRVRRPFEKTHGQNTFTAGDENEIGLEVLVGGKSKGDRYRIKDKVVTMVYRHIHGSLINILTRETIETGKGYVSKNYTSQYLEPISGKPLRGESDFTDDFGPLFEGGPFVLRRRSIETKSHENKPFSKEVFTFSNLTSLD